jgi:hypothetical protein
MRKTVSEKDRTIVAKRANYCCEYCRLHERYMFLAFEIDHIISLKYGGGNELENLAYSCPHCNQYKGSDLTTFLESYDDIVQLYNPRKQIWSEHFETLNGEIIAKTRIGKATVKIFRFNDPDVLILRRELSQIGLYP